jgi:hypothetical protein
MTAWPPRSLVTAASAVPMPVAAPPDKPTVAADHELSSADHFGPGFCIDFFANYVRLAAPLLRTRPDAKLMLSPLQLARARSDVGMPPGGLVAALAAEQPEPTSESALPPSPASPASPLPPHERHGVFTASQRPRVAKASPASLQPNPADGFEVAVEAATRQRTWTSPTPDATAAFEQELAASRRRHSPTRAWSSVPDARIPTHTMEANRVSQVDAAADGLLAGRTEELMKVWRAQPVRELLSPTPRESPERRCGEGPACTRGDFATRLEL